MLCEENTCDDNAQSRWWGSQGP